MTAYYKTAGENAIKITLQNYAYNVENVQKTALLVYYRLTQVYI